jgi:hypothetical protein
MDGRIRLSAEEGLARLFVIARELDAEFEVYGNCPVQAFGTVLGRDVYFHARHESWSFDVADHAGKLPSDGFSASDGFYRGGVKATDAFKGMVSILSGPNRLMALPT